MRKYLIAGVSVLALGVSGAMAQQATVNQSGTNSFADVNQTGAVGLGMVVEIDQVAGDNNDADALQVGNGNGLIDIDQAGDNNIANAAQSDFAGAGASRVTINQGDGGDHFANVIQTIDSNTADIQQTGFNNSSTVDQLGAFAATANVTQTGTNGRADVLQAGASDVTATINQGGLDNEADINQVAAFFSDAEIEQGDLTENNDATITQFVEIFSDATIRQLGTTSNSEANIFQTALGGHTATITQTDKDGAIANINQAGVANSATVTQ